MMPPAVIPLVMNVMVALLFIASFLLIGYLNPSARRVRWMAASYAIGMLEPVARLSALLGAPQSLVVAIAPCLFLTGLALMAPAQSIFYRKPPRWRRFAAIMVPGFAYYTLFGGAPATWFWHETVYQGFFALSMFLCAATVARDAPRTVANRALTGVFGVAGIQFLLKPTMGQLLGQDHQGDYAASLYAVFSQSSSGLLVVAAGLLILITVLQMVVLDNHGQARRDPLTGLPNRRALEEAFARLAGARTLSLAIIDVDRFKAINDTHGHDAGDAVLREVADRLERTRPANGLVARIGGEEFALLLPDCEGEPARLTCESVRLSVSTLTSATTARLTVSIGLTTVSVGEDLLAALRRADGALYEAKRGGRNRCVITTQNADRVDAPRLFLVRHRPDEPDAATAHRDQR